MRRGSGRAQGDRTQLGRADGQAQRLQLQHMGSGASLLSLQASNEPSLLGRATKQRPTQPHPAPSPGSMSRRTNLDRSSGVSWLGSVAVMPSLARRRSMTGAKRRPPFWSGGHSRLNRASSDSAWGGGRGRGGRVLEQA